MNNIEHACSKADKISDFARGYFEYLDKILAHFDVVALDQLAEAFQEARREGNTIFVIGNGGSATTASTMANDMGFDVVKKARINKPFKVLALTDNTGVMSAIANDVGYENVFVGQLEIQFRAGDMIICISASGNSPNVVKAAEWVKERGGKVVGLLGFDGGRLKEICDIVLHVEAQNGEYGPVEDAHLIFNHVLTSWFQCKLRKS